MKRVLLLTAVLVLLFSAALGAGRDSAGEQPQGTAPTASPAPSAAPVITPAPAPSGVSYLGQVYVPEDAEYVDMGETVIKDWNAFYAFLDRLPNLKSADLFATRIRKARIEELAARYPGVHFGMSMAIAEHTVRTDQTAFSTLHNKRSAGHTSEDFSVLKYCDNLLALDVGHNHVDDLTFLYDLPNLRVLIIAINAVSDITPMSCLKDLEYAEIFNNHITDLTPLEGLENLLDLDIAFNNIRDFTPVCGLKKLERLWLYNANNRNYNDPVPFETVQMIYGEIPGVYIDMTHFPTTGGWREHPRYEVIKKMFAASTYIPFEESRPGEE